MDGTDFLFTLSVILCLIITGIQTVDAGKCLQDAQGQCHKQSAGLIQAVRERKEVCSAYADYDSCIKTSITKLGCRLAPKEADLYELDITDIYTKHPYGCTKTESGWVASLTAKSSTTRTVTVSQTLLSLTIVVRFLLCL